MRLLPRISTTVSVGTSTSVISACKSVSRMRAFRLSRTFFSCPEYVCKMNHCCIALTLSPPRRPLGAADEPLHLLDEEREGAVNRVEVDREEQDGDDRDDRRVPDLHGRRPRHAPQLGADVAHELRDAPEEAVARAGGAALAPRRAPLLAFAEARHPRRGVARRDDLVLRRVCF